MPDSHTLIITLDKVSGHQHKWLAGGYDLETTFLEVDSMVVIWWIVAFVCCDTYHNYTTEHTQSFWWVPITENA